MARAELWPTAYIRDKVYLYTGLQPSGGGAPPLHHLRMSVGIPIGARQRWLCLSFTSTLSTPIFDKT